MKAIFYRCKINGETFKLIMNDNIPTDQVDACLDAIIGSNPEFISEEDFFKSHKDNRLMDVDVFDTTDTFKIGVLTTRFLNLNKTDKL